MATPNLWGTRPVGLREIWPDEARDFTPWLFRNLHLLGEVLGIDLEAVRQEVRVGRFSLDILARHTRSACNIAIENQLEESDQTHLGQLLTYAAGSQANTMIWVAARIREEHRKVIDRYNRDTPKRMQFYGIEARVFGIESSPFYALEFSPEVCPREWSKGKQSVQTSPRNEDYSETVQLEMDYSRYTGVVKRSRRRSRVDKKYRRPTVNLKYVAALEGPNNETWAYIFLDGDDMKVSASAFDELEKGSKQLEASLNVKLFWSRRWYSRSPVISIRKVDGWTTNPPKRIEETKDWMLENLSEFEKIFRHRLDKILANL